MTSSSVEAIKPKTEVAGHILLPAQIELLKVPEIEQFAARLLSIFPLGTLLVTKSTKTVRSSSFS